MMLFMLYKQTAIYTHISKFQCRNAAIKKNQMTLINNKALYDSKLINQWLNYILMHVDYKIYTKLLWHQPLVLKSLLIQAHDYL